MSRSVAGFGAVVLAVFGVALMSFGVFEGLRLAQSYRVKDILYRETPEAFQAWLDEVFETAAGEKEAADRIAQRLQVTRPAVRRMLVAHFVAGSGIQKLAANPELRLRRATTLLDATEQTVERAPASPDLQILAAALRARTVGLSNGFADDLERSRALSPRELDLVLLRLDLARTSWLALSAADRHQITQDFEVLSSVAPERATAVSKVLTTAGVEVFSAFH